MALRDRGVWFGRRRWIMAVVGGVLVLGVLPGGAVESVLAQDPPAPACEQGLFAEGVTSPASCPTSATTTDVSALALPSGFAESTVFSGLTNPINIEFAADGRIFVAEKSGVIKVYDNLNDTTPTSFGVLPPNVHNFWDRGLLGLALDPSLTNPALPSRPWIYVLYAYDHILGNPTAPPRWGDTCPSPPGPTTDGCVVSGRLARFTVSGTTISGPETVLIEDWCQQFPSHSQGNLAFGPDGALYVSAGDGASFNVVDYGQLGGTSGTPPPTAQNPCSDPALEGGALRSQDLRTEPVGGGGGASYADAVAQDTPIAWYRMGEPSGAVVDQTGGSDGTALGGVTRDIPGPIGASDDGAIDFNGTSGYVSVPHQAKLSLGNGPWSIELWARRDSIGGNYRFMVDKGETSPGMYFDITSNRFTLEKSNNPIVARESGSTTDSNWHHWVATRSADGLTTRIYKDGTNVTVLVSAQTFASTTTAMFIGAFVTGGPGFLFDGAIDEVAVYNVELPTSRVEAHYAAASGGGATEPVTLDGAILRVDPVTGAAFTGNPFAASSDANKRRIIAYGLRNPFRFDVRPGTNEIWVGDVGWNAWEEINRVASIGDATVENFGWPCYEGTGRQSGYDAANLPVCEALYQVSGAVTAPTYTYNHSASVVSGDGCPTGGSSTAGIAFYPESGGTFPAAYRGGLFFADYTRNCIWWMAKGADGQPDPATRAVFVSPAAGPVDLEVGPDGALYYVGFNGTVRRVQFSSGNQPPTAIAQAAPSTGPAPLTVTFDGRSSTDPEGGTLAYAWDLDGDGAFDDSTSATPTFTYSSPATVTVSLRVTDPGGLADTDSVVVSASNTPPVPVINTPAAGTTWEVGEQLFFSGSASDAQDGSVPASRLSWQLTIRHCPSTCHSHVAESFAGVAGGSFFGPDHEYPAHLELTLTATDAQGATASVTRELHPKTVILSFATTPSGLELGVNASTTTAPFTREVIKGSLNSLSASSPQTLGSTTYQFTGWSDGGGASHIVTANAAGTFTASFTAMGSSTTLVPVADAEIRSKQPARNFGTLPTLSVRNGMLRSYLRFNVPTLSGTVAGAKLRLFVVEAGTAGGSAFAVGSSWNETDITWNNAPPISGNPLGTAGAATVGTWLEFDVTSAIASGTPVGFAVSGGNNNAVDYSSRSGSQAPQLVITTAP